MRFVAVILCAAMLLGCGATVESSSPRSVVVEAGALYGDEAMQTAEKECQKYGRHAQLKSDKKDLMVGWVWTFDCVE